MKLRGPSNIYNFKTAGLSLFNIPYPQNKQMMTMTADGRDGNNRPSGNKKPDGLPHGLKPSGERGKNIASIL